MYFVDDCHAEVFIRLVAHHCKERPTNYWAAYYILTCNPDIRTKTQQYMGRFIDWVGILNKDFSRDYQELVQFAFLIFSNTADELRDVGGIHIKDCNIVTQALEIRKNGIRPTLIK